MIPLPSIFRIFNPAPCIHEIKDPQVVQKDYRYWRLRIFYSIYLGYMFYQLTRKSFCQSVEAIHADLGYSRETLGWVSSTLFLSYGVSKFISGILSDRCNSRYFMAVGLICTGVLNFCLGVSSSLWLFVLLWALNGWFQGWGAAPCARLLTHWYPRQSRARLWAIWTTSIQAGVILLPLIIGYSTEYLGWRFGLYIPGTLSLLMGFFLLNRLRDTPKSLGLPPIERFEGNHSSEGKGNESEAEVLTIRQLLFQYVLKNPLIWLLGFSFLFLYFVRMGLEGWSKSFLIGQKGYGEKTAGLCMSLSAFGGFFGPIVGAWISDTLLKGRRAPVFIFFTLFAFVSLSALWLVPHIRDVSLLSPGRRLFFPNGLVIHSFLIDAAILALINFFIMCPQALIGLTATEISHKKAAGTANGFVGTFAYVGSTMAGGPLGRTIDQDASFNGLIIHLMTAALMATLLLLPLWKFESRKKWIHEEGANHV